LALSLFKFDQKGAIMQGSKNSSIILLALVSSMIFIGSLLYRPNEYVIKTQAPIFKEQVHCLAENIYYEAATEPYEGKLAVAQVTLNRSASGKFPSDICRVVKQKTSSNGYIVCQFSWYCLTNLPKKDKYLWEESQLIAKKALTEPVAHDMLYANRALYYHADYVSPGWDLKRITKIGRHIFYKEKTNG
jgi:spore germination cell wall hydrolase CwlJ-like protein